MLRSLRKAAKGYNYDFELFFDFFCCAQDYVDHIRFFMDQIRSCMDHIGSDMVHIRSWVDHI